MTGSRKDGAAVVSVYATFPDMASAEAIASALVESGLAACANLVPGMRSIFRWKGQIERTEEVVAFVKTTEALADDVIAAIEARHPYDTPAIVVLPIASGSRRYLDWIADETAGRD
jgi:periplasmic divalent cation tolerance protein